MTQRLLIAGHRGLLGSALLRAVATRDDVEAVTLDAALDFRDRVATIAAITAAAPTRVILVAARVGGLGENIRHPVEFLDDNLQIESNVLRGAHEAGVGDLLFVASANAYPAEAPQPIDEVALGTGRLDADTESYGLAKLVGMRLCAAYSRQFDVRWRSVAPCNLYGSGDRFDARTAHVVPAMIHRFHEAARDAVPSVDVWGSGNQRRQLMHADDLAAACLHLLDANDIGTHVNVGPPHDVSIAELARLTADVVGYTGDIHFDTTKPEGAASRLLAVDRIQQLGWSPNIDLESGVRATYDWYLESVGEQRANSAYTEGTHA